MPLQKALRIGKDVLPFFCGLGVTRLEVSPALPSFLPPVFCSKLSDLLCLLLICSTLERIEEECVQVLASLSSCSFSLPLPGLGPR